jgi:hypothetical protein
MDGMTAIGRRILELYDRLAAESFIPADRHGNPGHDPDRRQSIVADLSAEEEWLALGALLYSVSPAATLPPDDVREAVAIAEALADGSWEDDEDGTTSAAEWVDHCLKATPYGR